jgi:hypothetical protein
MCQTSQSPSLTYESVTGVYTSRKHSTIISNSIKERGLRLDRTGWAPFADMSDGPDPSN